MPTIRPPQPPPVRAASLRPRALAWALLFAAPLVLGLVARVDAGAATLLGIEGPRCLVGSWLAPELCPGCGLTRGVALLVRGSWRESLAIAPAALPLVLACALGLAAQLAVMARGRALPALVPLRRHGGRALAAALLVGWCLRIL